MSFKTLIIGAGPSGCATALKLASLGIASMLVDKETFPRDKICGDALSGKTVDAIKKINKEWVAELAEMATTIGSYGVVFSAPNGAKLRLPFSPNYSHTAPAPGFVAKRIDFDNWLVEKVRTEPLITFLENTALRKFSLSNEVWTAETTKGETLKADFIIAADGAYSTFAKNIALLQTEDAHNAFGIRAYYKNVQNMDAQNFIELHFVDELLPGYFWIFPLPNGEANVGAGIRADHQKNKKINLKQSVESIIKNHPDFRERFKEATLVSPIKLFGLPLGSKKRKLYGERFLLIGDAAMLIDPFTGEGIGNGMISGIVAAQTISDFINKPSTEILTNYQATIERQLGSELRLSSRLQQLANYPRLFNFVVKTAANNSAIQDTFSTMFYDVNIRAKLKNPIFYLELLFSSFKSKK
jgi:geranylgeranyl reductase family protein